MPRAFIAAVVAALIAVLTAGVYFVTTAKLENRIREDAKNQIQRARDQLVGKTTIEALQYLREAQGMALKREFVTAIGGGEEKPAPHLADQAIRALRADAVDKRVPDVLALVNRKGEIVVLWGPEGPTTVIPKMYLSGGKLKYKAIELAMERRGAISEVWNYQQSGPMLASVAPVEDTDFDPPQVAGALVVGYFITEKLANADRSILGVDVAYFYDKKVVASSLRKADPLRSQIGKALFDEGLATTALQNGAAELSDVSVGGEDHVATAIRMPRQSSLGRLGPEHPPAPAGVLLHRSVSKALAPVGSVKMAILLLGLGALLVAMIAIMVTSKTILGPLDEIEVGINDIINGNVDHVFEPVGRDVDGLANALNVMLARLLGRPEPGEEEYDENGEIIRPATNPGGGMSFDAESLSPKDAAAMKLAQEPEDEYFERLFKEFLEARDAVGESNDGITKDGFIAKLRINEGNMKKKYDCATVRFKVVTKDDKVTLKPVPIA